jgi:uncharacterized protein YdhG (YjbR/CyaY superfamily)
VVGGTFNLELPENYTVKSSLVYWIRKGNDMLSFSNQKQYLNLFPEKADDIKSYIRQFRLKFSDKDDLVKIVNYSGSI